MRRKRKEALSLGFCITCCKKAPIEGKRICHDCNVAAKARVVRIRERKRKRRQLNETARSYEATGDIALERLAYVDATVQFEHALAELPESANVEDEVRLCQKIGDAVCYGVRPDFATPWFERAVERCKKTESLHAMLPAAMAHLPPQLWIESRTTEAINYSLTARELAVQAGDMITLENLDTTIISLLILLGRYDEAAEHMVTVSQADSMNIETPRAQIRKFKSHALIYSTQGRAGEAFRAFEHAIDTAKELVNGFILTTLWDDYANWAIVLGRLGIARTCRERALLVARERSIAWRIPYFTLRFASMLVTTGDYDHALDLVRDALTYDTNAPVLRVLLSIVGIEVALVLGDDALLKRVFDNEVLELAFQSEEPERIAPIVVAHVKVCIIRRQLRRARTLIARAMTRIHQADHAGDLLALAARYGSSADALRARELLEKRMKLPHHRVTQAYVALWRVYDAKRRRSNSEMHQHAEDAARLFARLGYKHQQAGALALMNPLRRAFDSNGEVFMPIPGNRRRLMSNALGPTLTMREHQVADLVLRGLSNRAIAKTLKISEHTVETHMTSILNRMGLRSRWQLLDLAIVDGTKSMRV